MLNLLTGKIGVATGGSKAYGVPIVLIVAIVIGIGYLLHRRYNQPPMQL